MNADFTYDLNIVIDKLQNMLSDYGTDEALTDTLASVEEALDILEDADVWLDTDDTNDEEDQ